MGDLGDGLRALEAAQPAYRKAADYDEGKTGEVFTTAELEKLLASVGSSFRLNFASLPIDKLVRRVQIASVNVEGDTRATRILQAAWDDEELSREFRLAIRECARFGDSYVIAWPDEAGNVHPFYNSPLTVRAIYSADNPRLVRYVVKLWKAGKRWRVNLYYLDRIERYETAEKVRSTDDVDEIIWDEKRYVPLDEDDDEPIIPNEFGFIPVWHLRHEGTQYGVPAHRNAYGPQDSITKIVVTQMTSFDGVGYPTRVALRDPEAVLDDGGEDFDDDTLNGFDDDTAVGERRRKTKLRMAAGTTTILDGIKSIQEFQGADPDSFLKPAEFYIRSLANLTDLPLDEVYPGLEPPSGVSRRIAREGINSHARTFIEDLDRVIERFCEGMLAMLGVSVTSRVNVSWKPVETIDDLEGWDVVSKKIDSGVPLRVALAETGYSEAQIAEWYPEDTPGYSPAGLAALATMLKDLGTAVTLGIIGREQVVELLPQVFAVAQLEADTTFVTPSAALADANVIED